MNSPGGSRLPESKPRVGLGAGILIVSPDGRLLIVQQEHDGVVDWGPLGGGMEAGEGIRECAVREAYEESGLRVKLVRLLSVDEFWHAGQLQRVGFVFLAEPDPWPQRVSLPDFDGDTRFLDHRWISEDEVQRFAVKDSWEFWACYWPLDVHETLHRTIHADSLDVGRHCELVLNYCRIRREMPGPLAWNGMRAAPRAARARR